MYTWILYGPGAVSLLYGIKMKCDSFTVLYLLFV